MTDASDPLTADTDTPTLSAPHQCPRCSADITGQEYYGVCPVCTTELRSRFDGSSRKDVAADEYEPKMNVTPNAVASKE